jgi:uncharacterized protein (TIGR03067 family)
MNMKHQQSCLSSEVLKQLTHDELSPSELEEIEEHVGDCDRCRDLLEGAQSDPQWQDEIVPILQTQLESPHVASDGDGESLESILQLLGPTDDPHMLGRIGSYEVVGVIGRGGMGVVFNAFEPALNRFVAIKMLLPHLAASGAARKRFAREGQAAAAVIDDHVLPIYNVAEWQGVPYLVTQYSRGATLQKRMQDQGPLGSEAPGNGVLKGTWAFVSIEGARPDGRCTKRKFEGDKERYVIDGQKLILKTVGDDGKVRKTSEFDITIDTKVTPHRLTLKTTVDRLSIRYIFDVKGDTLRMCFFALGEENGNEVIAWPTEFSLKKGLENYPTLQILKRVVDTKEAGNEPATTEPKDGVAWGETVDGLQLAMNGIEPGTRYKSGDTIRFGLSVRNGGTEVIRFKYNHPKTRNWIAPRIDKANGDRGKLSITLVRGGHKIFSETLEPNAVVSLQVVGVLALGDSDTAAKTWPRIEKPQAGEYRLRGGYVIEPLDANGKHTLIPGTRTAKYAVLSSGTVTIHID